MNEEIRKLQERKEKLLESVKITKEKKQNIIKIVQDLVSQYNSGRLSKQEYDEQLNKFLDKRSSEQWIKYYEDFLDYYNYQIKLCDKLIKESKRELRREILRGKGSLILKILIAVVLFALILSLFFVFKPKLQELVELEGGVETQAPVFLESGVQLVKESLTQYSAVLGKPVKWKKEFVIDGDSDFRLELPESSKNIKVKQIQDGQEQDISSLIKIDEKGIFRKRVEVGIDKKTITGNAVLDVNAGEIGYEVEFETPSPEIIEQEISKGKRIIIRGPDDVHYENILSFTKLAQGFSDSGSIKLYEIRDGKRIETEFSVYDTDEDGEIDFIEWITPYLSEAVFEIVIEISKAEHLDSDKNFISDIYEQVKAQDDIWSEEINDNEYVRVVFEEMLDNTKDITLYPRIVSGEPKIEVYEFDGGEILAEFENLTEGKNTIYLTELDSVQDVFDLRVVDGIVEIDYIVDPLVPAEISSCSDLGMISYWTFDDGDYQSSPQVDDVFGGNHGTNYGAATGQTGQVGEAFSFDGDDYVLTPSNNALDGYNSGSVSFWFKYSGSGANSSIVSYTTISTDTSNFVWRVNSNGILEQTWYNGGWKYIRGITNVEDDTWHFVVFSADGIGSTDIYLDGYQEPITWYGATNDWINDIDGINIYDHHISIGSLYKQSPTNYFQGQIDEVAIFDRELTYGEIQELYQKGLNGENYCEMTPISTCEELQDIQDDLAGNYYLTNDIDCSMTNPEDDDFDSNGSWADEKGFIPIRVFTGTFDGQGQVINDLYINRPGEDDVGLFGLFGFSSNQANIHKLGLLNVNITGRDNVGALVGRTQVNNLATIKEVYSTGQVSGSLSVGGLIGLCDYLIISNSYSMSSVSGDNYIGGLIGYRMDDVIFTNSYSKGLVEGLSNTGGLIGAGEFSLGTSNCFWDTQTSEQSSSFNGGTGKTTAEMKQVATYTDTTTAGLENPWDFLGDPYEDTGTEDIWKINEGLSYPCFQWQTNCFGTLDISPPDISFLPPTPNDGSSFDFLDNDGNDLFVKVFASDVEKGNNKISTFIDFDNSLVGWWRMDDVSISGLCYQETATQATACGGLSGGEYVCTGDWGTFNPCIYAYDGDWDTFGYANNGSSANLYVNYSIPKGALDSSVLKRRASGSSPLEDLSIPQGCLNQDPLQLKIMSQQGSSPNQLYSCYDYSTGSWYNLKAVFGSFDIYDEAMVWDIDEVVIDNSSYNNDGTVNGDAHQSEGYLGKGFEFSSGEGLIDYINLGNKDKLMFDRFTISAWIKPYGEGVIIDKSRYSSVNGGYCLEVSNSSGVFMAIFGDSSEEGCSSNQAMTAVGPPINLNEWTHVVVTSPGGRIHQEDVKIYYNGLEQIVSYGFDGCTMKSNSLDTFIGFSEDAAHYPFNGLIDDLMVFNRDLSADEISALYADTSETYLLQDFNNLIEGKYVFKAYTQDIAGNVNMTEEREVNVLEPPDINFLPPTPDDSSFVGPDFFVNVFASDVGKGDNNISTFIDFDNSLVGWWRFEGLMSTPLGVCDPDLGDSGCTIDCDNIFITNPGGWSWNSAPMCLSSTITVPSDVICDGYSIPDTYYGACATFNFDGDIYECPSYDRKGSPIEESDCFCAGAGCLSPYTDFFDFSNEFFTGPGALSDNSGYGNDGIVNGNATQTDAGYMGKGFEFDGDGDYVSIPFTADEGVAALSVSFWMKQDGAPSSAEYPLAHHQGSNNVFLFATYSDGDIKFQVTNASGDSAYDQTNIQPLDNTNWHHIVGVYNGTNIFIYVDNATRGVAYQTLTGLTNTANQALTIGILEAGSVEFNGSIDDVMIFNRALSADEISALYADTSETYLLQDFNNLIEGNHKFRAYVQDSFGSVNQTGEREVNVIIQGSPEIVYVSDILESDADGIDRELTPADVTSKSFRFYAYSELGPSIFPSEGEINNESVAISLVNVDSTKKGEGIIRTSAVAYGGGGCVREQDDFIEAGLQHSGELAAVYVCKVNMQHYDDWGSDSNKNWEIRPYIKDSSGLIDGYYFDITTGTGFFLGDYNLIRPTYFHELIAQRINSGEGFTLNFAGASIGNNINIQPTVQNADPSEGNYPLLIENTGNSDINNVNLKTYDIPGVENPTEYIQTNWFSVGGETLQSNNMVCSIGSGARILGETLNPEDSDEVLDILPDIPYGEPSIPIPSNGLTFCLREVQGPLSAQDYSTVGGNSWDINFLTTFILFIIKFFNFELTLFVVSVVIKKKKKKSLKKKYDLNESDLLFLDNQLKEKYNIGLEELLEFSDKVSEKYERDVQIPVNIFNQEISPAEVLCKYLKENLGLNFREIGRLINRDERTVWINYRNAVKKMKKKIRTNFLKKTSLIKEKEILVSIKIFSDRRFSVLESVVNYLKEKDFRNSEIAEMLGKDQRNIYTLYSRAKKKLV